MSTNTDPVTDNDEKDSDTNSDGSTHVSSHDERTAESRFPGFTRRGALSLGGTALGVAALGGSAIAQEEEEPTDDAEQEEDSDQGDDESPADADTVRYRVTVTNLTRGQPFTPPAIALHEPSVQAFSVGSPANEVVQQLAENGNLDPLVSLIGETDEIRAAAVGDSPLVPKDDPGDTGLPYYAMLEIDTDERATHLTFLSMLIGTNDGFAGLDTVELPTEVNESRTLHADSYDAGTEQNTENFDDMVPPAQSLVQGGEASGGTGESNPDIAEDDVIRPHPGITGDGDLSPEVYGWNDPVGTVHVERIAEGASEGAPEDESEEAPEDDSEGASEGAAEGAAEGESDGEPEGESEGEMAGESEAE